MVHGSSATKAVLLRMVEAEAAARRSERLQLRFRDAGLDGWMDVCAAEQRAIVTAKTRWPEGTTDHRAWLDALRTAHLLYPGEPAFRELPVQVKYNRRTVGLPEGMFLDVTLHNIAVSDVPSLTTAIAPATTATMLSAVVGHGPHVIIAGSLT